jgi:hypothetical protein
MAKPKKSAPKSAPAAPSKARNSTPAPAIVTASGDGAQSPLTPKETRRLLRISRFLLMIRDPALFLVALAHGYTPAEHEEGWALFRRASGEGQAMRVATQGAAPRSLFLDQELQALDAFENLWFPRVRAVIERVVPSEHRATFLATFFRDLTQQPLGPGVILSVRGLVERLAALPTSGLPGAAAVRDTLRTRGLTDDVLAAMRARVAALETIPALPATPAAPVAAEGDAAPDHAARRAAYEALSAWFNDWGTTLRSVYNKRELVQLGLRVPTRKGAVSEEDDGNDDRDGDAPADG